MLHDEQINIIVASSIVVVLAELIRWGKSSMYFEPVTWQGYWNDSQWQQQPKTAAFWCNVASVWIVEAVVAMLYREYSERRYAFLPCHCIASLLLPSSHRERC